MTTTVVAGENNAHRSEGDSPSAQDAKLRRSSRRVRASFEAYFPSAWELSRLEREREQELKEEKENQNSRGERRRGRPPASHNAAQPQDPKPEASAEVDDEGLSDGDPTFDHGEYGWLYSLPGKSQPKVYLEQGPNAKESKRFKFRRAAKKGVRAIKGVTKDFRLTPNIYQPLYPLDSVNGWKSITKNSWTRDAFQLYEKIVERLPKCLCEDVCDEDCLNRVSKIECDALNCPMGKVNCGNRALQTLSTLPPQYIPSAETPTYPGKRLLYSRGYEVFATGPKGFGLRAVREYEPHELIVEYTGEVITNSEMGHRMATIYSNTQRYYCLSFVNGLVIDSGRKGSEARYVNHSCSPNSEMQKWYVRGSPRIGLFAGDEPVPAGTELTYDYNFDIFKGSIGQKCYCGEPNCRGIIGKRYAKPDAQESKIDDGEDEDEEDECDPREPITLKFSVKKRRVRDPMRVDDDSRSERTQTVVTQVTSSRAERAAHRVNLEPILWKDRPRMRKRYSRNAVRTESSESPEVEIVEEIPIEESDEDFVEEVAIVKEAPPQPSRSRRRKSALRTMHQEHEDDDGTLEEKDEDLDEPDVPVRKRRRIMPDLSDVPSKSFEDIFLASGVAPKEKKTRQGAPTAAIVQAKMLATTHARKLRHRRRAAEDGEEQLTELPPVRRRRRRLTATGDSKDSQLERQQYLEDNFGKAWEPREQSSSRNAPGPVMPAGGSVFVPPTVAPGLEPFNRRKYVDRHFKLKKRLSRRLNSEEESSDEPEIVNAVAANPEEAGESDAQEDAADQEYELAEDERERERARRKSMPRSQNLDDDVPRNAAGQPIEIPTSTANRRVYRSDPRYTQHAHLQAQLSGQVQAQVPAQVTAQRSSPTPSAADPQVAMPQQQTAPPLMPCVWYNPYQMPMVQQNMNPLMMSYMGPAPGMPQMPQMMPQGIPQPIPVTIPQVPGVPGAPQAPHIAHIAQEMPQVAPQAAPLSSPLQASPQASQTTPVQTPQKPQDQSQMYSGMPVQAMYPQNAMFMNPMMPPWMVNPQFQMAAPQQQQQQFTPQQPVPRQPAAAEQSKLMQPMFRHNNPSSSLAFLKSKGFANFTLPKNDN